MSRLIDWISAASVALATVTLGCGGGDDDDGINGGPASRVEPQLPQALADALDFWWQQGEGTRGEHLVLATAESSDVVRAVVVEVPLDGAAWQDLFEGTPDGSAFSRLDLVLSRDVNDAVRATVSERIANELDGRATFERPLQSELVVAGGEPLDALVIASALLALPNALGSGERDPLLDTLTFAHAVALRRETDTGDAAAYTQTYRDTLATLGWVSGGSESGELSTDSTLLASMAPLASAEPWLRALGLVP